MSQYLNPVSIFEWMKWGEEILKKAHKQDASIDAKLLMKYLLDCDETYLLLNRQKNLEEGLTYKYQEMINVRSTGIPLQHITGNEEFMGLSFKVNEHVLIPRQDTETLIEELILQDREAHFKKGIDIGTGSGCISISLAHYLPDLTMCAVDISEEALKIANENVKLHGLEGRISCMKSDLFSAFDESKKVDLIVSNPPYISKEEVESLEIEVVGHEPRNALTDEGDGLSFYRAISKQAKSYLKKGGTIAYEIGYNQAKEVTTILENEGYCNIVMKKDLAQNDRIVTAKWK